MNYPEFKQDLQRIHESEVYGISLFGTAALLTFSQSKKEKWLALKALEEKTLEGYIAYMKESDQELTEPKGWHVKGIIEGAALGLLPWRLSMKLLRDGTVPFQETFLRLKNNAESIHLAFFSYVYAHEKAIEAFAIKELASDQNSLMEVKNLLGSTPATSKGNQ